MPWVVPQEHDFGRRRYFGVSDLHMMGSIKSCGAMCEEGRGVVVHAGQCLVLHDTLMCLQEVLSESISIQD